METDFAAVRQYLEGAWLHLRGDDETTRKIREAIDLLVEAAMAAEYRRPTQKRRDNFPKPRTS